MLKTYEDQYEFAMNSVLTSIENGNNIVLYGKGCNGKSFLVNEIRDYLETSNYFVSPQPAMDWTCSWWNNFLDIHDAKKWIVCINDKNILFTTLGETPYTLINMDKFCYPKYATLRSGRAC